MLSILKSRWVLFVVITLFVLFKIHHLYYPYFWDESAPYASAIDAMSTHGFSLLPTAIDPELYRGHPPLFIALAGMWMHMFGNSHVAMHSFALLISITALTAIYETMYRLFNKRTALLALLLLSGQVVFFVQSSFVLLEVMVALLALLSLYFYCREQYIQTAICLTLLLYTKESGVVMWAVLGIDSAIRLPGKEPLKKRITRTSAIIISCVPASMFFIMQKHVRGWYVFPLHAKMIVTYWCDVWRVFKEVTIKATFIEDYRYYLYYLLTAFAIYIAVAKKKYGLLSIIPVGIFIYFFTVPEFAVRTNQFVLYNILFCCSIGLLIYYYCKELSLTGEQRKLITLGVIFVFSFALFSAFNFFTYRYLIESIIILMLITAVFFDRLISLSGDRFYYPILITMIAICAYSFYSDYGQGDTDLSCFDNMTLQQSSVDYLEQHNLYDAPIGAGSYLQRVHLTDPATGFLSGKKIFKNVDWEVRHPDYIIVDNIEPDYRYDEIKNKPGYQLIYRNAKGLGWIEIYGKTRK